jgi:group I intron endonuclease
MIGLYAIVHVPSNRAYVGSTNDFERRFKEHKTLLRKGKHYCKYLQNSWSKYGEQNFAFKKICINESLDEAREIEEAFLDCFFDQLMNVKNAVIGAPFGDSHFSKKPDWHMKTVMQRLTPEERKAKYGKTKGTKRDGKPYVLGASKRLSDPEYTKRLSEACKGKREIVECPHCGLKGGGGNMTRYHFNKCKDKK